MQKMTTVEVKLMNYIDKCYKVLYLGDVDQETGQAQIWHRYEFKTMFLDNLKNVIGELKHNITENLFD